MKLINSTLEFVLRVFFDILFFFKGKPKFSKSLKRTIDLYKDQGFGGFFSEIRSWDAPYEEMEKLVPERGLILDIGSGDGLFANYLGISSPKRKVVGVELRKKRVRMGERGVPNVRFKIGNVLKINLPKADAIIMFHLLHHIHPRSLQEELIKKSSKLLGKGGKLMVVEITQKPVLKYLFCFLIDAFVLPILFDKKLYDFNFHYRNTEDWRKLLSKNGFSSQTKFIHRGMPFPHVIISATKK